MEKDVKRVVDLHQTGGLNCSQAMFSVYGKYFGIPEDLAVKIATGFGGGMGGMGETCGAVTGAFLVLGMLYNQDDPSSRSKIYCLEKEFVRRFKTQHGSVICRALLGYDMGTEEGMRMIRETQATKRICPLADQSAAIILEELLEENQANWKENLK